MILFLFWLCFRGFCFFLRWFPPLSSSWSVFLSSFCICIFVLSYFLSIFVFVSFFLFFDFDSVFLVSLSLMSLFFVDAAICKWFISSLYLFSYFVADYYFPSVVFCCLTVLCLHIRLIYMSFIFVFSWVYRFLSPRRRLSVAEFADSLVNGLMLLSSRILDSRFFLGEWLVCSMCVCVCVSYSMSPRLSLPVWSAYACLFVRFAAIWYLFESFACLCYYFR